MKNRKQRQKEQKQNVKRADLRMSTVCSAIAKRYALGTVRLPAALESAFQAGFRLARRTLQHNEQLAYAVIVEFIGATMDVADNEGVAKVRAKALNLLREVREARAIESVEAASELDRDAIAEVRAAMSEDPSSPDPVVVQKLEGGDRDGLVRAGLHACVNGIQSGPEEECNWCCEVKLSMEREREAKEADRP